jgi:hypothetical protein
MNYRTMEFSNGCKFWTTWALFVAVRSRASDKRALRACLLRPDELDAAVLNTQAQDLFKVEPKGFA